MANEHHVAMPAIVADCWLVGCRIGQEGPTKAKPLMTHSRIRAFTRGIKVKEGPLEVSEATKEAKTEFLDGMSSWTRSSHPVPGPILG